MHHFCGHSVPELHLQTVQLLLRRPWHHSHELPVGLQCGIFQDCRFVYALHQHASQCRVHEFGVHYHYLSMGMQRWVQQDSYLLRRSSALQSVLQFRYI